MIAICNKHVSIGDSYTLRIRTDFVFLVQRESNGINGSNISSKSGNINLVVISSYTTRTYTIGSSQHRFGSKVDALNKFQRLGICDKHRVLTVNNNIELVAIAKGVINGHSECCSPIGCTISLLSGSLCGIVIISQTARNGTSGIARANYIYSIGYGYNIFMRPITVVVTCSKECRTHNYCETK